MSLKLIVAGRPESARSHGQSVGIGAPIMRTTVGGVTRVFEYDEEAPDEAEAIRRMHAE